RNARRHGALALDILQSDSNCWIQGRAQHLLFAIDLLRSDFAAAHARGQDALKLAEQSGNAATCRNCLANLGNFFYFTGQYDGAVEHFERALAYVQVEGTLNNAAVDGLALVRLSQGHLDDATRFVDRILASLATDDDLHTHPHRHTAFTKTLLLAREGRWQDAIAQVDRVLTLAERTGDTPLQNTASLTKAELQIRASRLDDALPMLEGVLSRSMSDSPELHAQYERALAVAAAASAAPDAAATHHCRGVRLAKAVGNVPAEQELERVRSEVLAPKTAATLEAASPGTAAAQVAVQSLAALALHPNRPDFVARELVFLLVSTGCVYAADAILRSGRRTTTLAAAGASSSTPRDAAVRTVSLGRLHDQDLVITVRPKPGIEAIATLNAVTMIVAMLQKLEQARREREDRAVLWPVEELSLDGDPSVLSGHMRELMQHARRIAKTNVSVLITGESGTGKEILARAIHLFSDRAPKPFIPINCTAVPRDLLESHLFGHRRGAFTGADRDYTGLIRAARDGTLFLDEIGALGLDVQPKLLRFLESGEIATLGDTAPATVDVRIVAATNRNLDEAV